MPTEGFEIEANARKRKWDAKLYEEHYLSC